MQASPDFLPVGSVIHSMLTEAQFQAETSSGWILADGRSVAGSRYAAITGATNAPDAQGRFLRGRDAAATTDPDGTVALGTQKADRLKAHAHYVAYSGGGNGTGAETTSALSNSNTGGGDSDYTLKHAASTVPTNTANHYVSGDAIKTDGTTTVSTGADTRPLNIIMNVFIRIN